MQIYKEILGKLSILKELSKLDLKKQYAGTFFGFLWAYVNPMVRILVYWFVFAIGIKGGENGLEYGMWLITGLVPWLYFNDAIRQAGKSYRSNASIIRSTPFNLPLFPASRMISLLIVNLGIVVILFVLLQISGINIFQVKSLQVFYLLFAQIAITQAIVWLVSPFTAFSKDIGQFLDTIMIILFWMTPILFPLENIPHAYQFLFKLNPLYYVINEYRNCLYAGNTLIFDWYIIYFWASVVIFSIIGNIAYKRLKPIFVDRL